MQWIIAMLFSCGLGTPEVVPVSHVAMQNSVASIRTCLIQASETRIEGRQHEAQAQVMGCYRTHFEPLEPSLRALNPRATLSLEYGFGQLIGRMGHRGAEVDIALSASQLADRVESVLDTMPATPTPPSSDTGASG